MAVIFGWQIHFDVLLFLSDLGQTRDVLDQLLHLETFLALWQTTIDEFNWFNGFWVTYLSFRCY